MSYTIQKHRRDIALGIGFGLVVAGVLIMGPLRKQKFAMESEKEAIDNEKAIIYMAAGVVRERTANGKYQETGIEGAMQDFAFERIRMMEESLAKENSR